MSDSDFFPSSQMGGYPSISPIERPNLYGYEEDFEFIHARLEQIYCALVCCVFASFGCLIGLTFFLIR